MSEVAGKMSVQEGAKYLEKPMEGRGILLGGIPGVEPAKVLVLGGRHRRDVRGAAGRRPGCERGRDGHRPVPPAVSRRGDAGERDDGVQHRRSIRKHLQDADLVIGAVLIPGARCPMLVRGSISR
jgi:alanine dehydrogenase